MAFHVICAYDGCQKHFTARYSAAQYCSISCASKDSTVRTDEAIMAYFLKNVHKSPTPGDCWEWIGMLNDQGYGMAHVRKTSIRAHRLAYQLFKGPLDSHQYILHNPNCRTRACVNPAHLRIGSQKENAADRKISGTQPMGDRHYRTAFLVEDVRNIRKMYADGILLETIADAYNAGVVTIHDMVKYKTWKHVDPEKRPQQRDMRYKLSAAGKAEVIRLHLSGEQTAAEIAKAFNLDATYVRFLSRQAKKSQHP